MDGDKDKLFEEPNDFVTHDAFKIVNMRLVRTREALTKKKSEDVFNPQFCHQHFGEEETIYGYTNPSIDLWFNASDLTPYFSFKHDEKIKDADDVIAKVKEHLPFGGVESTIDGFASKIDQSAKFRPPGELIHEFSRNELTYGIYKTENTCGEQWTVLRERIEHFAYWFIDAATYTDADDDKWKHYIIYEHYKRTDGSVGVSFVGYAALYWYYAYANMFRPRVGQILILPPYQKHGLGAVLLQTIYNDLLPNPSVKDITAEDPALGFVQLRDYVNACNCSKLKCMTADKMDESIVKQVAERLKLPKMQIIRAHDILCLSRAKSKVQLDSFKKQVQTRLRKKYQKRSKLSAIMEKLDPKEVEEINKSEAMTQEQKQMALQSEFEALVEEYRCILNRVITHPPSTLPSLVPASSLSPPVPPTPQWLKLTPKNIKA